MLDMDLFKLNSIQDKKSDIEIEEISSKDIAIIGMALRFPNADSIEEFWRILEDGVDCIGDIPEIRKNDINNYLEYSDLVENTGFIKAAYMKEIDKFDCGYFRISPKEAELMDPHHRMFMEVAIEALEDAGYGGNKLAGSRTGVYVGLTNFKQKGYSDIIAEIEPGSLSTAVSGNLPSMIPSRISYFLDLKGPSMAVDTACSSSLTAVHIACQALRNGECDMALTGSVKIHIFPLNSSWQLGIESSDGKTKAFDESADGTGIGEGVAALLLKPYNKAVEDGDNIYAIIKGSAVNQDGSSIGITAPNSIAQADVIQKAWENAGIDPETITYIEAHGTGTKLGDPIEIDGIQRAFEKYTDKKQFCSIGSLKTNIGHLLDAAGIASLIKAVLMIKNKKIPPSLHFKKPNSKICFEETPVYVNTGLTDWNSNEYPRRCGVSSFGISGTNCHMILEEAPLRIGNSAFSSSGPEVLTLSAKSKEGLITLCSKYHRLLSEEKDREFKNVCYTANTGRGHYNYRMAIIAKSREDAKDKLGIILSLGSDNIEHLDDVFYGEHGITKNSGPVKDGGELTDGGKEELDKETVLKLNEYVSGGKNSKNILRRLCSLYVTGAEIEWDVIYRNEDRKREPVPVYPFKKVRCWLDIPLSSKRGSPKSKVKSVQQEDFRISKVILTGREDNLFTEYEKKIAALWGEILGFDKLNIYDDFYEIGGDSILATKIVNGLNKQLGVDVDVTELMEHPTVYEFAGYLDANFPCMAEKDNKHICKAGKSEQYTDRCFKLTPAQKRLFTLHKSSNVGMTYNIPSVMIIEGMLDKEKIENIFKTLIGRHEALRTSFEVREGVPYQKVNDDFEFTLEYSEYEAWDRTLRSESEVIDELAQKLIRPFDISRAPLFRASMVKLDEDKHVLIYDMHHIVSDGTSVVILSREFGMLYNQESLPEMTLQFTDYSVWQNERLCSEEVRKQDEFWLNMFSGNIPVLSVPTDYTRTASVSFKGERVAFETGNDLAHELNRIARESGTTLYMVLLAGYNVLLHKYSGQSDIVIGSPIAGRPHADLENIVGMFVNTLPMRNYPHQNKTFKEFLEGVKDNALKAYENQDSQMDEIIDKLNLKKLPGRNLLFDTMFILQNMSAKEVNLQGLRFINHEFYNKVSKFDITLEGVERKGDIHFTFEYRTSLYKKETMQLMARDFLHILKTVSENINIKIGDIELESKVLTLKKVDTEVDFNFNL